MDKVADTTSTKWLRLASSRMGLNHNHVPPDDNGLKKRNHFNGFPPPKSTVPQSKHEETPQKRELPQSNSSASKVSILWNTKKDKKLSQVKKQWRDMTSECNVQNPGFPFPLEDNVGTTGEIWVRPIEQILFQHYFMIF